MKNKKVFVVIPLITLLAVSCKTNKNTSSSSSSQPIDIPETVGVKRVDELSILNQDLKNAYAPALGDVKLLVVPISFDGTTAIGYSSKIKAWTDRRVEDITSYYFGETDSLAAYYRTASFNKLRITGKLTEIYSNTTYSISSILADESMETLWDMMDAALNWVHDNDKTINWQEYDLNHDGCVDNIHFITDYGSDEWADNLWPHMFWTGRKGTVERPMANVYSMSGTSHVTDPITSIHEQGHIFGLDDYYDYSNDGTSPINYIGCLDMQAWNCFDWNSYSKLSTGWVNPYVVDGSKDEAVIALKAASLNGDCLIIPADYSTWNGSAFDEYFLIELFAPFGNNEADWNYYRNYLGNEPGVRMYHVDARCYGSNKTDPDNHELLIVDDLEAQEINTKEDCQKWDYVTRGANDCSNWRDYEGGVEQLGNYPLLTVIQKGKDFTFGNPSSQARHILAEEDLFRTGDTFSFSQYSHFLNKKRKAQSTMDNGEIFPYEISFGEMDNETIVVTVKKVK